jgi:hypothetical protein
MLQVDDPGFGDSGGAGVRVGATEFGAAEKIVRRAPNLGEIGSTGTPPGDDDCIPTRSRWTISYRLTHAAFGLVSNHCVTDSLAGNDAKTAAIHAIGQQAHHK